jgi:hypothetical protein
LKAVETLFYKRIYFQNHEEAPPIHRPSSLLTPSSSSYLQQLPSINELNETPLKERKLADFGEITGIGEFQDPESIGTRGLGPLKKRYVQNILYMNTLVYMYLYICIYKDAYIYAYIYICMYMHVRRDTGLIALEKEVYM